MQYLITEEELGQFKSATNKRTKELKKDLQKACTLLADTVAVDLDWTEEKLVLGCILSKPATGGYFGYCDDCIAADICPYDGKQWSK